MNRITIIIAVITIILNILVFGINIFMSIKLKFAKTQKEAMSLAKNLFLNLGLLLISCIIVYFLFEEFTSPAPLDKASLLRILLLSFSLFNIYFSVSVLWVIRQIFRILRDMLNLIH